jgi:single-strand DNA-binding protein
VRFLPQGDAVVNLSLAFTYGRKGEDGTRPTQWVEASFWGKRAETLAPYLLKGSQVVAYLEDVHIEEYEGANGKGTKLVGKVSDVELVSNGQSQGTSYAPAPAARQAAPAQRPQQRPAPAARQAPPPQADFEDDDIPFITSSMAFDMTTSKTRKMSRYDY